MLSILHTIKELVERATVEFLTSFREIQYFHPSGKPLPNGSHYQRGGFLNQCKANEDRFAVDECVCGEQSHKGGIIVFSSDAHAPQMDEAHLSSIMEQLTSKSERHCGAEEMGAYRLGHFFKGRFVGKLGESFDEKSLSVIINGLSRMSLLRVAERLAQELMQTTVLVKDLNKVKIYLASDISIPSTTGN